MNFYTTYLSLFVNRVKILNDLKLIRLSDKKDFKLVIERDCEIAYGCKKVESSEIILSNQGIKNMKENSLLYVIDDKNSIIYIYSNGID